MAEAALCSQGARESQSFSHAALEDAAAMGDCAAARVFFRVRMYVYEWRKKMRASPVVR